ncbi:MAG: tol-pal system protein YbgF [Lautropia sp.]
MTQRFAPRANRRSVPSHPARPSWRGHAAAALLAVGAAGAAATPAWALFGDDEARKAVLDVRNKLEAMQRDTLRQMNELGRQQLELEQRLSRLEQGQRVNIEQQNQLETLRQEVARLRGQVEVQLNELAQTRRQQREMTAAIDSRLKQFEPVQVTIDDKQVAVDQTEKRTYDAALELFRGSDFKGAASAFQAFQKTYPSSPYRPLALYWQGGAHYANGEYKAAISALDQLASKFPDSPRVPDAMLILGNAQADAGDRKSARETYRSIGERFPNSPASGAARERMAALGK